ncbi:MAG: acetyl-CoA carboxylase, biotin carboxyl carrier protein [Candidatus Omnitrophota bacterium]|nr:MAG: acetyl-CoA carboxylase, biotin carboxyl carrier protein [Candidatus Omnitrophota bacterium]
MNLKELKQVVSLMVNNQLAELEIEHQDVKIKLKRSNDVLSYPENFKHKRAMSEADTVGIRDKNEHVVDSELKKENIIEIRSPMVGTFYRAPSPDSEPFVKKGSQLEIGQVICIVEAMKLMNEIKSEVEGKVKEILVENGDPLEFGQVVFKIEKI